MQDCFVKRYTKMRVKTAPRQRILQSSIDGEEEERREDNDSLNGDLMEEGKEAKCCQEVLDMSMKLKGETPDDSSTTSFAGPSSCEYLEEENNSSSDNNNIPMANANTVNSRVPTTCSCMDAPKSYRSKVEEEALNLCKKDLQRNPSTTGSDAKLKDTFLYKIMTDPTFLENLQKPKQSKRHVCQFCKQEFLNGDELADHMLVKKDQSNQVVCCACDKTFAQKRYLRYHQRCHSETAMYTCDICTKKYTRLDNLTRHNVFHVNPKKFCCAYCDKTFSRKDLLNKHLKCHDNKYSILCELCHKYFKHDAMMENHKKVFHATS